MCIKLGVETHSQAALAAFQRLPRMNLVFKRVLVLISLELKQMVRATR